MHGKQEISFASTLRGIDTYTYIFISLEIDQSSFAVGLIDTKISFWLINLIFSCCEMKLALWGNALNVVLI